MQPRTAASPAAAARFVLVGLLVLLLLLAPAGARGQAAPGAEPETLPAGAAPPHLDAADLQRAAPRIPECGLVTVQSGRCDFQRINAGLARVKLSKPTTTVLGVLTTTVTNVALAGNGLRQVLKKTFAASPRKPVNYRVAPVATVTVTPSGGGAPISRTARLTPSRDRSVQANPYRYKVQVKQGGSNDNFGDLATGKCTLTIRAPCSREGCPEGQADFGAGCVAVCPNGQVDAGSGCATPAADACPTGEADFGSGCTAATPTVDVCPEGEADFGAGCEAATATSAMCPAGEAKFGNSATCAAATPTADVCPEGEASFGSGCVAATDSADVCENAEADFGAGCTAATPTADVCPEGETDFGSGCEAATATSAVCPAGEAKFGNSATCAAATPTADVCPEGEADFGSGCVAATDSADVCGNAEADFGAGCAAATPTADVCPDGQASFGSGCVAATATSAVCSNDEAKFGDSTTCVDATPTADVCPEGQADFGAGCEPVCPNGQVDGGSGCVSPTCCADADTVCAAGSICPDTTLVSPACADRSAFSESPCACTALEQLAALSGSLQTTAPWDDLANLAYCQEGSLYVECATVGGVRLPTIVDGRNAGVAGALPPSLGELGPSLTLLGLRENAITSVPTELGALTGLTYLDLESNALSTLPTELAALTGLESLYLNNNLLTGVPTEFRTVNPSVFCDLYNNPGFSCANVGFGTSCCNAFNCGDDSRAGPCY